MAKKYLIKHWVNADFILEKVVNEDEPCAEEPRPETESDKIIKDIIDTDEKVEDLKEDIKEIVGNVNEETKQSLDEVDPWMARKMEEAQ